MHGQNILNEYDWPAVPDSDRGFELKDLVKNSKYNSRLAYYLNMKEVLGRELHKRGVDFYLAGDYPAAIQMTQKAIKTREQVLPFFHTDLGQSYYNLGIFYKETSNLENAEACFLNAAKIFDRCNTFMSADSRREIAAVLTEKGDFDAALNHLKIGIQKAHINGSPDLLADCYIEFGKITHLRKNFSEGIDTLLKAKKIFESFSSKSLFQEDAESRCYNNLAALFYETGNYSAALDHYNWSFDINRRLNNGENIIRNHTNLGLVYLKLKLPLRSRDHFQKAMDLAEASGNNELQAVCHDNLGELYLQEGAHQKALEAFQRAIVCITPGYHTRDYFDNPPDSLLTLVSNKTDLLVYFSDKARAWVALYQETGQKEYLNQSLINYLKADRLINLMRFDHREQQSKFFWRENTRSVYEQALDACYELGDIKTAFYFFEKSKAAMLLDALVSANAKNLLPDSITIQESRLKHILMESQKALEAEIQHASSASISLREAVAKAQKNYTEFVSRLSRQNPQYYKIRYSSEVINIEDLQNFFLNDSTNFIHYLYGERFIYTLNIGNKEVFFNKTIKTPQLDTLISNFFDLCKDKNKLASDMKIYAPAAFEIYQKIFSSAWKGSKPAKKRCIIAPDGHINYISFESLMPSSVPVEYDRSPFLIKDYLFYYVYSATVWRQQQRLVVTNNRKLFALAPFTDQDSKRYLPASKQAVKTLEKKFRGEFYSGKAAELETFLKNAPDFQVIYLFTHASAHPDSLFPYIQFHNANLYLNELYGLTFASDLVVLSACETALGKNAVGEGILSLGMGFSYTGARSFAASLWKVNDNATERIFSSFFDYLAKEKPKAEAFRLAKLDYLKDDAVSDNQKSPFYWAAFVLTGDDMPIRPPMEIKTGSGFSFWTISTGILVILIAASWFYFRRPIRHTRNG